MNNQPRRYQYVNRWVMTHVAPSGDRTLSDPMQGRYTYETPEAVQERISAVIKNSSKDSLRQVYGEQALETFEPREVKCYAGGHDPTTRWFD